MKISIIVPVYKGEQTLEPLYKAILAALNGIIDFEVIFVCDKAIDGSWSIIQNLRNKYPQRITGYKLKHNYGQHKATLFGFTVAKGDFFVTMDEDMQHDPAYIPAMLDFLNKNSFDVVYGDFTDLKKDRLRKAGSGLGRRLAIIAIPGLHEKYSPFRILKAEVAGKINYDKRLVFIDGLIADIKAKIGVFTIEHLKNRRPSSYSFFLLAVIAVSMILSYSLKARVTILIFTGLLIIPALWNIVSGNESTSIIFLSQLIIPVVLFGLALISFIRSTIRKNVKVSETTLGH